VDSEFDDIRPYRDEEIASVLKRLSGNQMLLSGIRKKVFPRFPKLTEESLDCLVKTYFRMKLGTIRTVEQFQRKITSDVVLKRIINRTSDGLSFSGLENLERRSPHIFISNHRDIVLDSALLSYVVANNGFGIPVIAFGDNLMINEVVSDLIRANKAFVVKRGLPPRERIKEAYKLSRYIWHLHEKGELVWIAQREGRAKDGNDRTDKAVIKMLYLSQRKGGLSFSQYVRRVNIVPVAISYELDPCDVLKAKELKEGAERNDREKKMQADLLSMYHGVTGHKGRVHIALGNRLQEEYQTEADVAREIDRTIHRMYKLWPSNYIAYDEYMGSREYSSNYSSEQRSAFLRRFHEEPPAIRSRVVAMYAQPVINRRSLMSERDEVVRALGCW